MRTVLLCVLVWALSPALSLAAEAPPVPAAVAPTGLEASRAAFESYCSRCHPVERAKAARKDREGWKATVAKMAGTLKDRQGRDLPPGDQALIVEYLAGKDLVYSLCGKCHEVKRALSAKKDLAEWTATVGRMSGNHDGRFGGTFPPADQKAMAEWLSLNAGK